MHGFTDAELADFFGVSVVTLANWKAQFPAFLSALKIGKEDADQRVERSLYQRACGYSHPDVVVTNYQGQVTLTPITKVYPPDTTSCIFWLKNRKPEEWRDVQRFEHSGTIATNEDGLAKARERLQSRSETMQ